jgi:hypothetical protein
MGGNRYDVNEEYLILLSSLLTDSGLCSYDPQRVLRQLPQSLTRPITPSSTINGFVRTPINQQEMDAMLAFLNSWTPRHKAKLNRVTKVMKLINADLLIARDSNTKLFKANLAKESRKKKAKDETMRGGYNSNAFGRLLTEAEAKRRREEEGKKAEEISQKKEMTETKKLAAAVKKEADEVVKIEVKKVKEVARVEKKQAGEKEKADKKRKRQEVKLLKDLEKVDKPKKFKRRKLQSPSIPVDSTLQTKELEANIPSPNMKGYSYS